MLRCGLAGTVNVRDGSSLGYGEVALDTEITNQNGKVVASYDEAAFKAAMASPENAAAGKDVRKFAGDIVTMMAVREE